MRLIQFLFGALSLVCTAHGEDQVKKLVILGDSLTEGYGVAHEVAYPALLEAKIRKAGKAWSVVNAGLSGSTTASGPSRLKWHLKAKPELVIIALGANDGLRGVKIAETEKNLAKTIEVARNAGVRVILAGMKLPPNYGSKYTKDFANIYDRLAKQFKLKKIEFLLEGVAGHSDLNLADGIHPNERGHEMISENVFKNIQGEL